MAMSKVPTAHFGETEMPSSEERVIKSYVWYGVQCFFVSTINRESSAALAYGARYSETLVWLFDWERNQRGEQIHQDSGPEHSIETHMSVCKMLHGGGIRGLVHDDI